MPNNDACVSCGSHDLVPQPGPRNLHLRRWLRCTACGCFTHYPDHEAERAADVRWTETLTRDPQPATPPPDRSGGDPRRCRTCGRPMRVVDRLWNGRVVLACSWPYCTG